jgi:hypothetical protein
MVAVDSSRSVSTPLPNLRAVLRLPTPKKSWTRRAEASPSAA